MPRTAGSLPDCTFCPANSLCPGGAASLACPLNSRSSAGSTTATDCSCAPGYSGNDGGKCSACPAGSFCPGGSTVTSCPANSNSGAGSSKPKDCTCNAGYAGLDPASCQQCQADFYCPGNGAQIACAKGMVSEPGSGACRPDGMPCMATFVDNVGAQFPGQSAIAIDDNTFVFAATSGGFTKMVGVNKAGKEVADRYMSPGSVTAANWAAADVRTLGFYSVSNVQFCPVLI